MTPALTLLTVCGARYLYLYRHIQCVRRALQDHNPGLEHIILVQDMAGDTLPPKLAQLLEIYSREVKLVLRLSPSKLINGAALDKLHPLVSAPLLMKADDDCWIQSHAFFQHVLAVNHLISNAAFSPFPVGLINHLGGTPAIRRLVQYSSVTDTYYTLREVSHVGGFARICPTRLVRGLVLGAIPDEDSVFSRRMVQQRIPLFYLENALIVEHAESTLGQQDRGRVGFKQI